jgi:hypothetical protein
MQIRMSSGVAMGRKIMVPSPPFPRMAKTGHLKIQRKQMQLHTAGFSIHACTAIAKLTDNLAFDSLSRAYKRNRAYRTSAEASSSIAMIFRLTYILSTRYTMENLSLTESTVIHVEAMFFCCLW